MKDLLKTNCYDVPEILIIIGSCLPQMSPKAYEKLCQMNETIYEVCLEKEHLNMVVTKIMGMLSRVKVKKLIFATVDKSPHCVQLHYVMKELEKAMDLNEIEIENYVAVENELVEIPAEIIALSKNLGKLKEKFNEKNNN